MLTQGAGLNYLLLQWSPPLNDGNTCRLGQDMTEIFGPQWSPPLNGGST